MSLPCERETKQKKNGFSEFLITELELKTMTFISAVWHR